MAPRTWSKAECRGLLAVVVTHVLLGLGYSVLMPVWDAPDEQAHYRYALHLARHGERPPLAENHEAFQPILYYRLASLPLRLLDRIDAGWVDFHAPPRRTDYRAWAWSAETYRFLLGPLVLRWMGIGLAALTLCAIYAAARRLAAPSVEAALATVALAGLIPQFLHISASVSNGPLANLAGAGLLWLASRVCTQTTTAVELAATAALAVALPFVTKLTVLPVSGAVLALVAWEVGRRALPSGTSRARVAAVAGLVLAATVAAAWALGPTDVVQDIVARLTTLRPDLGDAVPTRLLHFLWSFWGVVGILVLGLSAPVMWALTAFAGVGSAASLRLLVRPRPLLGSRLGWALVWATIGLALLAVLRNFLSTTATQGRFLFPALGAIALAACAGWILLLPPRAGRRLPHGVLGVLVLVNLHFWLTDVVPFYYQPFLD